MFEYDSFYDNLFANEEFLNLINNFHSSKWEKLDISSKRAVIDKFMDLYTDILKIENKIKGKKDNRKKYSGYYLDYTNQVNVNDGMIEKGNPYDVLDTLFHELRHNFQRRAIVNHLSSLETVSKEEIDSWKENFLTSPAGYSNYIGNTNPSISHMYYYQPVESDAFKTGLALTKKSYDILSEKFGKDEKFVEYAKTWQEIIMLLFSDDETYVSSKKVMEKEVKEYFAKNNKNFEKEKVCLEKAEDLLEKNVEDLTVEEMHCLFSTYVWSHIDFDKQFDLLKRYDELTNEFDKVPIEKQGNSAFKVYGAICYNTGITGLLNQIYSWQYSVLVDMVLNGKVEFDQDARKELAVNMYKSNRKNVNYIRDRDNFILYSIQPYALYEGKNIYPKVKKVKEDIYKMYEIEDTKYDTILDYYDYTKYVPYVEKFFEKPFEEIYNDLVNSMKKRIVDIEMSKVKK